MIILPKFFRTVCIQEGWDGSYTAGSLEQLGVGQEQREKTCRDGDDGDDIDDSDDEHESLTIVQ